MLQSLINGLTQGAIYALIALGYTMVYGILGMINFAHGEVYMVGGYLGLITLVGLLTFGVGTGSVFAVMGGLLAAMLVAMLFCAAYGAAIEKVAYRPLRKAPVLSPLISAIGTSFFLWNFVAIFQGTTPKTFPEAYRGIAKDGWDIGNARLTYAQLAIFVLSILMMLALTRFVARTRTGKAMRATQEDKLMAGLVGINVDRVISTTFVIGSGLAATAGVMVSLYLSQSFYRDGYLFGLKAFTAAVLGGIGNLPGAMLGGFVLGLAENFAIYWGRPYDMGSDWKDVYTFVILLLFLIVRPRGILGERVADKV